MKGCAFNLPIINRSNNTEEGIIFTKQVKLSNNITGKIIMHNNIESNYIITKNGSIYNIYTEYELKPFITNGYKTVNIQFGKRGYYKTKLIHRLIGQAFIPNLENKPLINHKDGNKLNNDISNLEWATYSENNKHAYDTGLKVAKGTNGEKCNLTTHSEKEAILVCELLQSGMSMKDISKEYNLGYDFIVKIRRGLTWKYISKNYTFPDLSRYSMIFNTHEIGKMNILFEKGLSVRDVIMYMNWEFDEKLRCNVKYYKSKWKHLKETGGKIYYYDEK